jgi:hypothetical protein
MHAVTLEQQGIGLGIGQIVDRNQFQTAVGALQNGARDVTANATETIDRYLHSHVLFLVSS